LSTVETDDNESTVTTLAELSAAVHNLPTSERATLAVELIDSLGDQAWSEEDLARQAAERDAELESRAVNALSYEAFLSGLRRTAGGA
jgi:hypothetical protein